jgi:electron transfer flavoprotein alpha/beta subunit
MTEVWKIFVPERKEEQIILKGTKEEIAKELCKNLKKDKIL